MAHSSNPNDPSFYNFIVDVEAYPFLNKPPGFDPFHGQARGIFAEPIIVPPQVPYVGLPALQPTGVLIPEKTADADPTNHVQNEQVPVSHFYRSHIPHVTDWSCDVRRTVQAPKRSRESSRWPSVDTERWQRIVWPGKEMERVE
jgi:hypothetical protein